MIWKRTSIADCHMTWISASAHSAFSCSVAEPHTVTEELLLLLRHHERGWARAAEPPGEARGGRRSEEEKFPVVQTLAPGEQRTSAARRGVSVQGAQGETTLEVMEELAAGSRAVKRSRCVFMKFPKNVCFIFPFQAAQSTGVTEPHGVNKNHHLVTKG